MEERRGFGVGMPATVLLDQWGTLLYQAFGEVPYMVGSATRTKTEWRDVDIRLILDDDEWDRLFGVYREPLRCNARWALVCAALAAQGRAMTGLPIDFQIQRRTQANADDPMPATRHALWCWHMWERTPDA